LAGGIVGLVVVLRKAFTNRLTAENHEPLRVWGLYWHFMDFVWIYCFLLLLLA
jgi:cytochrome c oxidase subunit 3